MLKNTSFSSIGGLAAFGMSSLLEDEGLEGQLDQNTQTFADSFRKLRYREPEELKNNLNLELSVNYNMFVAAEKIRQEFGWSYIDLSNVGAKYARAVIQKNIIAYLHLVFNQWIASFRFIDYQGYLTGIIFVGCFCLMRTKAKSKVLFQAALFLIAFHFLHVFFCVMVHPSIFRHFAGSYFPALGAMYLTIFGSFAERISAQGT